MSEEGEYKPKENFENYIKYYYCREYRRTYPGIHQDLHDQIQTWFLQSVEKKSINTKYNTTTTTYFIEENEKCVNEINRFKLMKKSRISDPSRILTNKEEVQMMMSIDVCNIRKFGELTSEKKMYEELSHKHHIYLAHERIRYYLQLRKLFFLEQICEHNVLPKPLKRPSTKGEKRKLSRSLSPKRKPDKKKFKRTSGTASILSTSAEDTVKTQKLTTEMNSVQANLKSIPEAHRGDTSSQKVATHIPKMNHIVYAQGSSSSEARAKLQCEFNRHLLSRTSYSRSSGAIVTCSSITTSCPVKRKTFSFLENYSEAQRQDKIKNARSLNSTGSNYLMSWMQGWLINTKNYISSFLNH